MECTSQIQWPNVSSRSASAGEEKFQIIPCHLLNDHGFTTVWKRARVNNFKVDPSLDSINNFSSGYLLCIIIEMDDSATIAAMKSEAGADLDLLCAQVCV